MGWGRDPRGSPLAPQTFVSLAFSAEQKLWVRGRGSGGITLTHCPTPAPLCPPFQCVLPACAGSGCPGAGRWPSDGVAGLPGCDAS